MGRAAEGDGRMVGEGAGEAERGRGVLHVSHIVRAAMFTNVHIGHAHSPFDDMLTASEGNQGVRLPTMQHQDTEQL